jgi:AraC-like DNA-binding protein
MREMIDQRFDGGVFELWIRGVSQLANGSLHMWPRWHDAGVALAFEVTSKILPTIGRDPCPVYQHYCSLHDSSMWLSTITLMLCFSGDYHYGMACHNTCVSGQTHRSFVNERTLMSGDRGSARRREGDVGPWTVSSSWMCSVRDLLLAEKLDAADLFARAGLDIQALADADARFDVCNIDQLWQLASEASNDPFIALRRMPVDTPTSFDVLAYAMMSCENLAQSVERMIAYLGVVSDAVSIVTTHVERGMRIEVFPSEPAQPGRSLRLDYTITTFLAFCRWVTGRRIIPMGVELSYPQPTWLMRHQQAFDCTPVFDAPNHALLLREDDLHRPLPTCSPRLSRVHDAVVVERLKDLTPDRIESRLALSFLRRLPDGDLRRKVVAADLLMSERTLQRRLEEAGTSFQKELDVVRRHLAEGHLADQKIPLQGVAYLSGFADESTFYRACKRWFEKSPGQVRAGLSEG